MACTPGQSNRCVLFIENISLSEQVIRVSGNDKEDIRNIRKKPVLLNIC